MKCPDRETIAWYDRNVPIWWKALGDLFADPIWEGQDLESYCMKWFGCGEGEVRAFMKGAWRDYRPKPEVQVHRTEQSEVQVFTPDFSNIPKPGDLEARRAVIAELNRKRRRDGPLSAAERARRYREVHGEEVRVKARSKRKAKKENLTGGTETR